MWKRYATSAQLRSVHEHVLRLLNETGVVKILGDATELPMVHTEDQRCIVENWMSRAREAGLEAVATKRPASYFGQLSVGSVQSVAPEGLTIRSFEDMSEARDWLRRTSAK